MSERPHIILLMADQLSFDCLSCYGDLGARTPNLDALAEESVVFDRAYCSTPLCVPTRTSIATGKWPHTVGAIVNGSKSEIERPFSQIGPEQTTIYERLVEGGYEVTHVGVQHVRSIPPLHERVPTASINRDLDHPAYLRGLGFDPPEKDLDACVPCPEWENGRVDVRFYYPPTHVERTPFDAENCLDRFWADRLVERVRAADPTRPHAWFGLFFSPHPPFLVPEPYSSMYDPDSIELPETVGRWRDGMPPFLLHGSGGCPGAMVRREEWRRTWAAYFGLVTLVDDCLGRVIAALKERGSWDDALVVFTSDHGEAIGRHCMFQKMTLYEESAHVPLLIKPPGGATGRRAQTVGHVDFADTICDYAGMPCLPDTWGASLRLIVEDANAAWRDATFCEFNGDHGRGYPSRGVITERYKYLYHFCGKDELYDLQEDPNETRSLVDAPEHRQRRRDLRARVAAWMRETGDMLDMTRDEGFSPARWSRFDRQSGWR